MVANQLTLKTTGARQPRKPLFLRPYLNRESNSPHKHGVNYSLTNCNKNNQLISYTCEKSHKINVIFEGNIPHFMFSHQQIQICLPLVNVAVARHILRMNANSSSRTIRTFNSKIRICDAQIPVPIPIIGQCFIK